MIHTMASGTRIDIQLSGQRFYMQHDTPSWIDEAGVEHWIGAPSYDLIAELLQTMLGHPVEWECLGVGLLGEEICTWNKITEEKS